ncbi:hypothetical protein [Yinghuangia soli]|uniref:Secreted protein n=1 Tax=Yinghuangia soli TaxID=2908204 RepID=A0AA41U069_9ACTN|nr:hypothetical protein [Yinghuangia soli]MCF2528271.1 hypothetical protein [Yinghuangia soli]
MRTERRWTQVVSTVLAAGALAAFGTVAGAGTASAEPYDCSADSRRDVAAAYCNNGTGQYRVVATCRGVSGLQYGPNQRPGTASVVRCPNGAQVSSSSWEITEW